MKHEEVFKQAGEAIVGKKIKLKDEGNEVVLDLKDVIDAAIAKAIELEREACAKVCDDYERFGDTRDIAAAIRGRT